MSFTDSLASYELPPALVRPALRACRGFNTSLDTVFYDTPALRGDVDLSADVDPEGSLLLVDPTSAPYIKAWKDVVAFIKSQTAAPGTEAAVRGLIEGLRTGKPDYSRMSPGLANVTRQQLSELQPMIANMGAVQSVNFKGVGPGGADIYQVKFEKGSLDYRVWLTPDGKIESANFRPSE